LMVIFAPGIAINIAHTRPASPHLPEAPTGD